MFYRKKRKTLGFTLIEVMISLFLSVMVAFFVYTMMISSYSVYRRISSVSKNANSIRFFISSFERSIRYSCDFDEVSVGSNKYELKFKMYDPSRGVMIFERYYFVGGGSFIRSESKGSTQTGLGGATDYNTGTLGLLKKDIILAADNRTVETVVISNRVRTVYFWRTPYVANRYVRLNLGVVYDDVIDASQNSDTGQIIVTGNTEINTAGTLQKRLYTFRFLNSNNNL